MKRLLPLVVAVAAATVPMVAAAQYGGRTSTVRCESDDNRTRHCRVNTAGGVRLVDQDSRAPCVQGRSWGYDRSGIWVSQGCRGRFQVGTAVAYSSRNSGYYDNRYGANRYANPTYYPSSQYRARTTYDDRYHDNRYYGNTNGYYDPRYSSGAGYYGGGNYGNRTSNPIAAILSAVLGGSSNYDSRYYTGRQPQTFRCESVNGQPRFCRLPFDAGRIDIRRQLSSTRCSEGNNWGWQRDGVWVERGCRAEFIVY